ncbi:MAG: DUF4115 domain-containing protein [Alphaproteobacteria bacterium]|nr:DUF4115 domain-containing protein [Alphaproteobacteria bacterium]MDP7429592.1 DUF4115 domain-containing protein [Alphaproteobacteria bacterium]
MSDRQSTERKADRAAIRRRLHLREVSAEFEDAAYDGIGADLRATRVRNGLDLVGVARALRIRLEYLLALEEGRFAELPGSVYAVGFVRTYAEHLGIDGEAAVDAYKAETSGQRAETRLLFPTPEPENRMPKGWLIGLSLALFALVYAGWYYAENKDQFVIEPVAQVPQRLATPEATETPPQPAVRNEVTEPAAAAPAEQAAAAAAPVAAATAEPEPAPEPGAQAEAEPQAEPEAQAQPVNQAAAEPEPEVAPAPALSPPMAVVEQPEPQPETQARTETETEVPAPSVRASQTPDGISRRLLNPDAGQALQGPSPASVPVDVVAYPLPSRPGSALALPAAVTQAPAAAEQAAAMVEPAPPSPAPTVAPERTAVVEPAPPSPPPAVAPEQTADVEPAPPSPPPAVPQNRAQTAPQSASAGAAASAVTATQPTGAGRVPQIFGAGNWNARVVVQARADAWVQVTTETGDLLLTRVLRQGDKFLAPPRDDIVLTTGNAGALEIFVDGNRLPSIGAIGEVARNLPLSVDWLMAKLRSDR